jgi:dolichyl-phosphate-mannose-protein mannosyltransferase
MASVRARRPASPPPLNGGGLTSNRFPHRKEDHLDGDERRAAASAMSHAPSRKRTAPGGLNIASGEWKLLAGVILVALAVRLFRLSKPNSVVCVVL